MRLILVRHGNTFDSADKIVWVGRTLDLPLVARGEEQARVCGVALARAGVKPSAIYAAPLMRTRRTAELLAAELSMHEAVRLHDGLNELDYGAWTGKSDSEVRALFGAAELDLWTQQGIWPDSGRFAESKLEVIARVQGFARDVLASHRADEAVVAVSSNGLLRYFLTLVPGLFEERQRAGRLKMRTGHFAELVYRDRFELVSWDVPPDVFAAAVTSGAGAQRPDIGSSPYGNTKTT